MNRTSLLSLRVSTQLLDELEVHIGPGKKYPNVSAAVRALLKLGLQVLQYQNIMKDPEKAKEFAEKMDAYIRDENMTKWAETLSATQLDGIAMLIQLEKDRRYDQKTFL